MNEGQTEPPQGQKKESRRERIARVKARIEAGTYVVDPREVSRKIIDAHLSSKKNDR